MNRFILSGVITILSASHALGGVLLPGTLTQYIALGAGGGTIGSTLFADFQLLPLQAGATAIDPNSVLVTPIDTPNNPSLVFQVNQSAMAGELFELKFSYRVEDALITGAEVALNDSSVTFDGANTAVLDLAEPMQTLIAFDIGSGPESDFSTFLQPISMLSVVMDLVVDGGLSGDASLVSATNQFTVAIPEPTSAFIALALFGVVIAHGGHRRRQNRSVSKTDSFPPTIADLA